MHELKLERYKNFYPKQLSGGIAQMVAFGRSVANGTNILLMDEPFSSVDVFVRHTIQDQIKGIQRKNNMTIVLVTHQIDEAIYLADTVVSFYEKKPTNILASYKTACINDKISPEYFRMQATIMNLYENGR